MGIGDALIYIFACCMLWWIGRRDGMVTEKQRELERRMDALKNSMKKQKGGSHA